MIETQCNKKRSSRKNNQDGFTLVEIIAVLVILGILAAVAIPKYFDLQAGLEEKASCIRRILESTVSHVRVAMRMIEIVRFPRFGDVVNGRQSSAPVQIDKGRVGSESEGITRMVCLQQKHLPFDIVHYGWRAVGFPLLGLLGDLRLDTMGYSAQQYERQ